MDTHRGGALPSEGVGYRLMLDLRRHDPGDDGVISRVGRQLGVGMVLAGRGQNSPTSTSGPRPGDTAPICIHQSRVPMWHDI